VLVSARPPFLPVRFGKTTSTSPHILDMGVAETGWADVAAWRLRRLLDAGFSPTLGARLATIPGVDVHALLELVDRGCAPDLAVRILGLCTDDVP
jgi:hypothetical protein